MTIQDPTDILILKYLAEGLSDKQISKQPDITIGARAVERRIQQMMDRLDLEYRTRTRLVAIAYETGIIKIAV